MNFKKCALFTVRIIFCLIFGFSFTLKVFKLSERETITKVYKEQSRGMQNTSMTICPWMGYVNNSIESLDDMPRIQDVVSAKHYFTDGSNATIDLNFGREFLFGFNWGETTDLVRCVVVRLPLLQPQLSSVKDTKRCC